MKVVGFSFVRNAIRFDYPIVEAISSILPLCDEVVVAVGQSEDDTLELVRSIDPDKVRIIETVWDDSLREGGRVLAEETMKAYNAIPDDADWCFYIQGDEVIHEQDYPAIVRAMTEWKDNRKVEGLVFDYRHFYGSYDYLGDSPKWYGREVRIIRKDPDIYSFRDAQGFQKHSKPLPAKLTNAHVHHYGWVKHPKYQQAKQQNFNKLWHDDQWVDQHIDQVDEFDYSNIDSLARYNGTHPKVMQNRIAKTNWEFSFDPTQQNLSLKHRLKKTLADKAGIRLGQYKNYRLV